MDKLFLVFFLMFLTCCKKQSEGVSVVSGVELSTGSVLVLVSSDKSQKIMVIDNRLTNNGVLRAFVDPVIININGKKIELKWGHYYGLNIDQISVIELSRLHKNDKMILNKLYR